MFRGKKFIAVIPARGGSKGLPGKNVKQMAGQPMIHWAIAAAKESGIFDDIIVSTDSKEIADVAHKEGVAVSVRPRELSGTPHRYLWQYLTHWPMSYIRIMIMSN